jgi:hypothetical protein
MSRWRAYLSLWSEWVEAAAALFILVLAARFTGVVFVEALRAKRDFSPQEQGSNGAPAERAPGVKELLEQLQGRLPEAPGSEQASPLPLPGEERRASQDHILCQLSVSVRPDRSEVFMAGGSLGKTPFIGDITCKLGELITVDILPPAGLPRRFKRPCGAPVVRIQEGDLGETLQPP